MMPKKRLPKIWLCLILLLTTAAVCYFFRYEIVFRFQYSRLQSLEGLDGRSDHSNYPQRLWVHRVNSLQRYDWLKHKFSGFETDIVFNDSSGSFSVYHPPLSKEGDTLSLDKFLSHVDLDRNFFWLDTRWVNASNALAALAALKATGKRESLKKACIIELYDAGAAEAFAHDGYLVGFNTNTLLLEKMEIDKLFRDSIGAHLRSVTYITQESHRLMLPKKMFPGKKILTWHLTFNDYFNLKPIQRLLDDPQIKIILVNIKSPYFR